MYTYAFLLSSAAPLRLPTGIMDSLVLLKQGELAALVEPELNLDALQQSDEQLIQAVLKHDRIVRSMFEQTSVLPLRFGTCFVSREGLLEHLQTHQSEYSQKLADLQSKAEYGLKFIPLDLAEPEVPAEGKGKAYFLAKKQRYQTLADQQQQQQVELQQLIETIAQTYPTVILDAAKDSVERLYLLSDRQEEPFLHQCLQDWRSQCGHWELSLSEALPPYHFV